MRCWPGCDAHIVAPYFAGAVGRVVHVERKARRTEVLNGETFTHDFTGVDGWVVSGRIPMRDGPVVSRAVISDHLLRPITPSHGTVIDAVVEPASAHTDAPANV